jgi:hypothetical protein
MTYVRVIEPIDKKADGSLVTLSYEHHLLHDGNAYLFNTFTTSLSTSASIDRQLHTSSEYELFSEIINIACDQTIKYELYEGTLFTTTGTTILNFINRNRNSTKTTQTRIYSDAVASTSSTNLGTLLRTMLYGSGTLLAPISGVSKDEIGLHYKKDTNYLLRITNVGTGVVKYLNYIANVYELQTT